MDILHEAQKLSRSAQELAQTMQEAVGETVQKTVDHTLEAAQTSASGLGVGAAGTAIAEALQGLPVTAQELWQDMPKLAYRLQYRAGLRTGDRPRADVDVMKLFEQIPGPAKLEVSEAKIRQFLADKHGSHIRSRHQGGANTADNILWEVGADNLRRGAKNMTGGEQIYIRFYNAVDSVVQNSGTIAKLGLTATGTAILTQAIVTAVAYTLDLSRGDITVEEFRDRIVESAIAAGIAAPVFFLVMVGVLAIVPELTVLLAAPAVVAGLNLLFGIGIAVPLIQSIGRHVEADGFGKDIAGLYQTLIGRSQSASS